MKSNESSDVLLVTGSRMRSDLDKFLAVCTPTLKSYIDLKSMTGLSRKQLLRLRLGNIKHDGLYVPARDLGAILSAPTIFTWTPKLTALVSDIQKLPRDKDVTHLFCNSEGLPYVNSRFKDDWREMMLKAIEVTDMEKMFSESDIPVLAELRNSSYEAE